MTFEDAIKNSLEYFDVDVKEMEVTFANLVDDLVSKGFLECYE